jgi:hypothetical protein
MSVLASGLSFQWLARPLILAIAVLLLLIAGTGFLGFQYSSLTSKPKGGGI